MPPVEWISGRVTATSVLISVYPSTPVALFAGAQRQWPIRSRGGRSRAAASTTQSPPRTAAPALTTEIAMNIETLHIDAVHEYDRNPRTINDAAIDAVAKSIQAFGFKIPILIESTGDHGRVLIELCGKGSEVTIVEEGDVSTHLLIHAVRQPGVLDVVRQVLALDATSVYEHAPGPFVGKTFDEAHMRATPGVLLGLLRARKNLLCPPGDTRIEAHDRLLVFANDILTTLAKAMERKGEEWGTGHEDRDRNGE